MTPAASSATASEQAGAELFRFDAGGGIPNSKLPLVLWRGRLPREARDGAAAGALFRSNGWQGTWVSNVLAILAFPHARA